MPSNGRSSDDRFPEVAIVGAGFGGLCMAAQLKMAGVSSFTIFEKGTDVGGIWRDNTYPGCGCDVPSHLYSFSFHKYRSAAVRYPAQPEILSYLRDVAARHDLTRHLQTGTAIARAEYDSESAGWRLVTAGGQVHRADVVVMAVGQLHRPKLPEIDGSEDFAGDAFHTARWNHSEGCIADRAVAIVGTGASGAQALPHVARSARRVYLYQRTPNWILPKPPAKFGRVLRRAFGRVPPLQSLYRLAVYAAGDLLIAPIISRGWSARPASLLARRHLHRHVRDAGLREELTPAYPIGCKRVLIDNDFYPTVTRQNVDLVTTPIERLVPDGIVTVDGAVRQVDTIVYATGFRTTEFLVPMEVRGSNGAQLNDTWADGAFAYLGVALPDFPNLFLIHGPNTILGHNSNIFMIECQVGYVMRCLRLLAALPQKRALEVTDTALHDYRRWLQRRVGRTVWHACSSWYKTTEGVVTNPWPATTMRYRWLTRKGPGPAFRLIAPRSDVAR